MVRLVNYKDKFIILKLSSHGEVPLLITKDKEQAELFYKCYTKII